MKTTIQIVALGFLVSTTNLLQAEPGQYPSLEKVFSSSETIIGQGFYYPNGTATITSTIIEMQPGQSTGWHRHEAPLFAMVLQGEITVDYGVNGKRIYRQNDRFIEAFQSSHNGTNTSTEIVRILAVFAGSDSAKNTVMDDARNDHK
jgi:quercetin dioxygenase-like cupin family protein